MIFCYGRNKPADLVNLTGAPFNLSPMLTKLMDQLITTLIHNCNKDINATLIKSIKTYKTTKSMDSFADTFNAVLPVTHKYNMLSIARRCALGHVWKRFVRKSLSQTMSAEVKTSTKQYFCPPVGVFGSKHYCRNAFCPHCFMRTANGVAKVFKAEAQNQNLETLSAVMLTVQTPFKMQLYGYSVVKELPLVDRLRKRISFPYFACKTTGANIRTNEPYLTTHIVFFVNKKNRKQLQQILKRFKSKLFRNNPEKIVELEDITGLDNICLRLYDCSPLCLAGLSKEGFSDSMLQHTLEEYKCATKNKKRTMFFGSRSL